MKNLNEEQIAMKKEPLEGSIRTNKENDHIRPPLNDDNSMQEIATIAS